MKEDVVAANLANLRQSINELKECIEKQNVTVSKSEQSVKVDFDEKTIYNGVAKSLLYLLERSLVCGKETYLETTTRHIAFFAMVSKLIELFKQKSKLLEYLYRHVCDYNLNRMNIEANTESILKRQDEIFAKINELKNPVTVIPPNINGVFIRGYHIKLRYVVTFIVIIVTWAVAASVSSMKYKEEVFAYYSMYRAVKEQHQYLMEKAGIELKRNTE